jgi:predicted amidophosphoribosyltransferase
MLIGMWGGWAKIAPRLGAAHRSAGIVCPGCGRQVRLGLPTCPKCGFDLALARLALFESRDAAGPCPKCGSQVAPTDQNCPSCGINLAWAREHLDELAGDGSVSLPDGSVHE